MPLAANSRFFQTRTSLSSGQTSFVTWVPPKYGDASAQEYIVTDADVNRVDLISQRFYGTVSFWWLILHFNGIADPFGLQAGDRISIPSPATVSASLSRFRSEPTNSADDLDASQLVPVTDYFRSTVPKLPDFLKTTDSDIGSTDINEATFNFGLEIPNVSALLQFQIQFSTNSNFAAIAANRFTLTNRTNWFVYDPAAANGNGAFVAFPDGGISGASAAGRTVYYSAHSNDPFTSGQQYYFRWRYFDPTGTESAWVVPPPIIYP